MTKNKNLTFDFLSEDALLSDIIGEILKKNDLAESEEEFFNKFTRGVETRLAIIRDATRVLVEKKVPKEKLAEFLAKHLETTQATTQNVVKDIKEKLLPYAKLVEERTDEEIASSPASGRAPRNDVPGELSAQEIILQKIRGAAPAPKEPPPPPPKVEVKEVEIKDVEKNAEKLEKDRQEQKEQSQQTPEQSQNQSGERQVDPYREPLD